MSAKVIEELSLTDIRIKSCLSKCGFNTNDESVKRMKGWAWEYMLGVHDVINS